MSNKRYIWPVILILSLLSLAASGCGGGSQTLTFTQLIAAADKYNGRTVTLEAFYFSGFEISALSGSLGPASSGPWRIVPFQPLVWVAGGISPDLQSKLYGQGDTSSGYPEHFGKLKVSGKFETGKFGHLDAYNYQITITSAELLDWSPPPAAANAPAAVVTTRAAASIGPADIFFPIQLEKYSRGAYPIDLAKGRLTLEDKYLCLAAFNDAGDSAVLIWPPGFSFKLDGQVVTILNKAGQTIARVGEKLQVGGGLVAVVVVEKYTGATLPDDCQGPYWLVSNVIP